MVTTFENSKIKIINRGLGWMLMDHFEFSLCFGNALSLGSLTPVHHVSKVLKVSRKSRTIISNFIKCSKCSQRIEQYWRQYTTIMPFLGYEVI